MITILSSAWAETTPRCASITPPARTPLNGQRLGDAVVGRQRGDVGRKFVTGKEGSSTIGTGFELLDEGLGGFFTALLAKVAGHPQATRQGYRCPNPIISLACCLFVRAKVAGLFLTKVHNSST